MAGGVASIKPNPAASTSAFCLFTSAFTAPPWSRRDWLWGSILILLVILVYTPIWHAGFIWDDNTMLTANPCVVGPLGLKEIWTTNAADICPFVITTIWVEHALWGLVPLPYHLVNILMHGGCAVLLWRALRSLRVQGAWLGAALWALHPVEVESVAWITEMKNTESALFFLLSILFFVKWLIAKDLNGRNRGGWYYSLSLLFAALAMASKSSTVVLPVVLCLCAWWLEGGWHWRNVVRVVPMFLMSIAASAVSLWTKGLQLATAPDPQWARPWSQRLAAAVMQSGFISGSCYGPIHSARFIRAGRLMRGVGFRFCRSLGVILLFCALWTWAHYWSRAAGPRACFYAFAYFLTALLPVLGLIDTFIFRYSLVFDHFNYLPSMGPLALAGAGLAWASDYVLPKRPRLQSALCTALLLIPGIVSWQRSWVYNSQESLWSDTLAKNPDCWLGHNSLGLAFLEKGQADEALEKFQKALEINPDYAEAHTNLGFAFLQKGEADEAIQQFQKSLEIDPNNAEAHTNLGNAYLRNGQLSEAIEQYEMAVKINPKFAQAHSNLGAVFSQKGELDEAIAQYHEALEINPNLAEAYTNLGNALFRNGRLSEAIDQYKMAVKINPKFTQAHASLGMAFFQKGRLDDAITEFQEALRLNPGLTSVQDDLAKAQALLKDGQK